MTNTALLKNRIKESGYRIRWLAQKIGISYQCFLNKVENKSEFKVGEMQSLSKLLNLNDDQKKEIFFAPIVDKKSTMQ